MRGAAHSIAKCPQTQRESSMFLQVLLPLSLLHSTFNKGKQNLGLFATLSTC